MDHNDYRIFLHIAETLHFARSARQLHMSASALTRTVQRIEESLGTLLLDRSLRQVTLTPAGERFRQFARTQMESWDALREELDASSISPSGELRIACTVSACYSVLPRLVAQCRERYPQVTLKLTTQDATRSMDLLLLGDADIAVVPLPDQLPSELAAAPLNETDLVFIAPVAGAAWLDLLENHPIHFEHIPFVAQQGGLERERLESWFSDNDIHPPIQAEVRGNEGIIALVSMGCGIGLVPELVLEQSPRLASVRRLSVNHTPRGYRVGLCVRKRGLERAALRAFWGLIPQGA